MSCVGNGSTRVVIENVSDIPLEEVVVHVTGNSYKLGKLEPHNTRSVDVNPTGESHVEIEHRDSNGDRKRLYVDCYLEPRNGGILEVTITPDSVLSVKHHRRL